jgi:ring-1,2-phenylacetyl-CoA epoxidase subunit PaaB
MTSLDPRVTRLPDIGEEGKIVPKASLDQFGTFEVFVQPKEGKPFQHEGIVHAPNLELAYVLAKETFTRRFTCVSLYVVETRDVFVSPLTDGDQNVYDLLDAVKDGEGKRDFEIFHLTKRGKQHVHVGSVVAASPPGALSKAKYLFNTGKAIYNVWAIDRAVIRFTTDEENNFWLTLPEKKFRDAAEYKGGDKLTGFLEKNNFRASLKT